MTRPLTDQLHTVRDYIRYACSEMYRNPVWLGHGTDSVWDEAVQLVLGAVSLPWNVDPAVLDARLTLEERERVLEVLRRRVRNREPLPYILGEAWFFGMPFYVNPDVLIPRSPIAELLEQALMPWLEQVEGEPGEPLRILDLCCGSGCIGLAAARAFPEAVVTLADISEPALEVARRNVERHDMADRVEVVRSDLFDQLDGTWHVILTNPPYVDAEDMADLPPEYRHEPELALAAGQDGLDLVRRILVESADHLLPGGFLVCEVGNSAEAVMNAWPDLMLTWPEFEKGGHGVFVVDRDTLAEYFSN
ncbi:50S ribosomal protein L3 N(5)-glutamine methyltransferase [Hahella sp. SMD15-11]|uniref:Ribosomal protein uL3 glutamine methyltransferase n=1 Tax=Thermohahella caldifontis TaxID=3142973 RepID=A0AB39UXZ4_9GAMM